MSFLNSYILLAPIGSPIPGLMTWLIDHLEEILKREVRQTPSPLPLPKQAFNPEREQYRGDALLEAISEKDFLQASRVVGLVNADCYAAGLNFIFGQAASPGRDAIVALPRLRQTFYDLPEDTHLFYRRALKEVIHELGHTWGLAHCPDPRCVMHFSNTL